MASTQHVIAKENSTENSALHRLKGKRQAEKFTEIQNRKTLQTLQYTSKGDNQLISQMKDKQLLGGKVTIKSSSKPVKIFADLNSNSPNRSPRSVTLGNISTQTDDSLLEELIDAKVQKTDIECLGTLRESNLTSSLKLNETDVEDREICEDDLVSAEPSSENYWRLLAEKRRQALNDTLEENEILHNQNSSLREENDKLTDLATQAETMVSFLQSVISSNDEDDQSETTEYKNSESKDLSHNEETDDWLNIELEGDTSILKSTEITTSTPEASQDKK